MSEQRDKAPDIYVAQKDPQQRHDEDTPVYIVPERPPFVPDLSPNAYVVPGGENTVETNSRFYSDTTTDIAKDLPLFFVGDKVLIPKNKEVDEEWQIASIDKNTGRYILRKPGESKEMIPTFKDLEAYQFEKRNTLVLRFKYGHGDKVTVIRSDGTIEIDAWQVTARITDIEDPGYNVIKLAPEPDGSRARKFINKFDLERMQHLAD